MHDPVNHPQHYTQSGNIECIDAIQAALTEEEFRGFLKGNSIKYLWRERHKGKTEDCCKGNWYLNKLIETDRQRQESSATVDETDKIVKDAVNAEAD